MKIKVTQDHINKGRRNTCALCPVALAIKEQVGAEYICVGSYTISIGTNMISSTIYTVPPECEKFMKDFDWFRDVSPFEFELKDLFKETEW